MPARTDAGENRRGENGYRSERVPVRRDMRKRIRAALAVLVSLATLGASTTACGSGEPESILDKRTLVVGGRPDLPLIGLQRPDGGFEGLDGDVAAYLADR